MDTEEKQDKKDETGADPHSIAPLLVMDLKKCIMTENNK